MTVISPASLAPAEERGEAEQSKRMRAIFCGVEANARDPFTDQTRVLSCRQKTIRASTSGEHEITRLAAGQAQIFIKCEACLLGQLKANGTPRLFLADRRTIECVAIWRHVIDAHSHDI